MLFEFLSALSVLDEISTIIPTTDIILNGICSGVGTDTETYGRTFPEIENLANCFITFVSKR